MSDDAPRRVPLNELVERLAAMQEQHYARVLSEVVEQIEQLLPEENFEATKRALVEDCRAMLAAHRERFACKVAALAARGCRCDDEALH